MKVGIVGASASGIYTALFLSRAKPDAEIVLFDRMDKPGKKLLATGNGHCNLFHTPLSPSAYNQPGFVESLLKRYDERALLDALKNLGIATFNKGELVYPLSYSASAYLSYLLSLCEKARVNFRLDERVIGVNENELKTNKGEYRFDHIVFAFGGCSQANLGSDGSLFPLLASIGYRVNTPRPVLCPLKSPDVPKSLFGVRHTVKLSLKRRGETLYEEEGEVLFKKDGLSGIAVMNASSFARPDDIVCLDFFPNLSLAELTMMITASAASLKQGYLAAILERPLAEYIEKRIGICDKKDEKCEKIAGLLKHLEFRISGLYGFDSSQVSRGGIDLSEVDENLRSKRNPNHWFVGECLDVDGLCGGYNLGFALLSAMVVGNAL